MTQKWRLVPFSQHTAAMNMAIDEVLFDRFREQELYDMSGMMRLYEFIRPSVTIGCFQVRRDPVCAHYDKGHDVVRRMTGGGLVCHDESLTFTVISHRDMDARFFSVKEVYKMLHVVVYQAFRSCGIRLRMYTKGGLLDNTIYQQCFVKPVQYDLMFGMHKVVGGAQKRIKQYFIHQGSIYLGLQDMPRCTHFRDILKNMIRKKMEEKFGICFEDQALSEKEMKAVRMLKDEKYATDTWNYKS